MIKKSNQYAKSNIEFIYWFAYYNYDSASVRYRAKYPLAYFKTTKQVNYFLVVPSYKLKAVVLFFRAYFSALLFRKSNSLIVIQRVQSNFIYSNLLKVLIYFRRNNTVYDLDDADYLDSNVKTIHSFIKKCKHVSAGSLMIKEYVEKFNTRVHHITSPIVDLNIIKTEKNELFTVGWIGGFGGDHKKSLIELVFPAIKELKFPLKFILLGVNSNQDREFILNYFIENDHIQIVIPEKIDWHNEESIQKHIVQFDVGIATLTNSELQLSKSGIKAKQYMNNGVPVLSTNLPENNRVVIDKVNGYLCDTPDDFKNRLIEFNKMSKEEFNEFIQHARQSIVQFNHEKYFLGFKYLLSYQDLIN